MNRQKFCLLVVVIEMASLGRAVAADLGTAFTYQGELRDAAGPVDGESCDFEFSLWDALNSGNQIGSTISIQLHDADIEQGRFTVQLGFGANVFAGQARWLEIAVCCPAPCMETTLSPRQELTPAPHALALPGMYTQQNATSPNVIGGYSGNSAAGGIVGGTIGGGGGVTEINTVGGDHATVGGGSSNTASGEFSAVPGGYRNVAGGDHSFAAGRRAMANHQGAFVWNDGFFDADFGSSMGYQFLIEAHNGVGIGTDLPNTQLEVNKAYVSDKGQIIVRDVIGEPTYGWMGAGTGHLVIGATNVVVGGGIAFQTGTGAVSTEKMRITDTGNVGIGTVMPSQKLHVVGDVQVDGMVNGVTMGKIFLNGNGTILTTRSGGNVLLWDETNGEIEITNTSGDWCDYWWQAQKAGVTSGAAAAVITGSSNVAIISGTNTNDYGFEVHFGQADGQNGWASVWLQYANGVLVGHYIKY